MAGPLDYALDPEGKLDPDAVQRNFDALETFASGTGGKSYEIRTGSFGLAFAATNIASAGGIVHGLGRIPVHVSLTAKNVPGYAQIPAIDWHNPTASTFDVAAIAPASSTVTLTITWMAIG
jgi:hypothetical protein